ncbi:MAG TPA: hypothetical protein VKW08_22280 [Xanthobacteraceae bacterium]|nr:hypothetical protein [Xanthobacteraceae bacterium]
MQEIVDHRIAIAIADQPARAARPSFDFCFIGGARALPACSFDDPSTSYLVLTVWDHVPIAILSSDETILFPGDGRIVENARVVRRVDSG